MAEEVSKWLVLQAETCEGEGGLWAAATEFSKRDDALEFVEHVIRDEWQAVVDCDTNPKNLADNKGYCFPAKSIRWSQVYYSEDGDEAWVQFDGGGSRWIKVVQKKQEGERSC